ncbi:hypothetical protein EV192_10125 [Actinocrispum wychmicini]|uniref:Uncharacterized protein n=1 Tax=Actinocrispum wychmicini TaxID=1213861 RepID=A0A4R2JUZ5_9PSEU|nr:hypothetical protein EV192_10125 [Actinocrispum wychmicini]
MPLIGSSPNALNCRRVCVRRIVFKGFDTWPSYRNFGTKSVEGLSTEIV